MNIFNENILNKSFQNHFIEININKNSVLLLVYRHCLYKVAADGVHLHRTRKSLGDADDIFVISHTTIHSVKVK